MLPKDILPGCKVEQAKIATSDVAISKIFCYPGDLFVEYLLFPDAATMLADFNHTSGGETLKACPGMGPSPQPWHRTATPQQTEGQIECSLVDIGVTNPRLIYPYVCWTIDAQLVSACVRGKSGGTVDEAYQWWSAHYS